MTPLYVAAQNGHFALVKALVKAGAAVNQARGDGATPLSIAAQKVHLAVAEMLVKAGAAVDQAEADRATPPVRRRPERSPRGGGGAGEGGGHPRSCQRVMV